MGTKTLSTLLYERGVRRAGQRMLPRIGASLDVAARIVYAEVSLYAK